MGWDPAAYGTAFADVYDEWYGDPAEIAAVVTALRGLRPATGGGRLLELGVGTGRLAIPLAADGWAVSGLDSSREMLERLARKTDAVAAVRGDAAVAEDYPSGPFDVVMAAYNFVFNLPDREAQAASLAAAARVSAVGAALVIEAFVPDSSPPQGRVISPGPAPDVMILTEVDPATGVVHGEHRHLDGRRRSWQVCPATPSEIDALAEAAGWSLEHRAASWDDAPFDPDLSSHHVSVYRCS